VIQKALILIISGILFVSLFVALGFLNLLSWTVVGIFCTILIGVFGWLVNLTLRAKEATASIKEKAEKRPTSRRSIVNKEIAVYPDSYETFAVELKEKQHLFGEISSKDVINVFLVTRYALSKFENEEEFSYEDCGTGEGIKRTRIDFVPSKTGRWFLIIENKGEEETSVKVSLFVERQ
jgi:hypothetical protein